MNGQIAAETERDAYLTAYTSTRPLLLLTDFPPDAQGGGAVILRSLLTHEDRERIVWVTLSPVRSGSEGRVVSLAGGPRRSLLQDATTRVHALSRASQAAMRAYDARAAWVVAHGAPVRVAPALISTGSPVHVTVHDDPAWAYALLTRRYLALAPLLARDLGRTLRGARSVDVVSAGMAERYHARYGITSTIVHRGLPGPVPPSPTFDRRDGLSVAVLGSTYGFRELKVLAEALALVGAQRRIRIRLTVIGGVEEAKVRRLCPPEVALETPGHLAEADGLARLRASFLLYLSYPFGHRGKVLRSTSFPTKLSTYVMAARPLLLHVPPDSSVGFLGSSAPYATLWTSVDPEEGAEIISALWLNEHVDGSFHAAAEHERQQHFDLARNRAALCGALNSLVESETASPGTAARRAPQ